MWQFFWSYYIFWFFKNATFFYLLWIKTRQILSSMAKNPLDCFCQKFRQITSLSSTPFGLSLLDWFCQNFREIASLSTSSFAYKILVKLLSRQNEVFYMLAEFLLFSDFTQFFDTVGSPHLVLISIWIFWMYKGNWP